MTRNARNADAHVGRLHAGRSDQHQRGPTRPRLRRVAVADADPWKDNPFLARCKFAAGEQDVDYFRVRISRDGAPWVDLPVPAFAGTLKDFTK